MSLGQVFVGVGALLVLVFLIVWAVKEAARRREAARQARQAVAERLGLTYEPSPMEDVVSRYAGLRAMPRGVQRYAENLFRGFHKGVDVRCFDYVYVTESHGPKGQTHRQRHYVAVAIANLGERFPRLTIVPETWGHKLWDAVGGDDIDFESAEFSRRFWVKSDDKRFAYAVLHPRAMEYLLAAEWKHWELRDGAVAAWTSGRIRVEDVEAALDRIVGFVADLPAYMRQTTTGNPTAVPAGAQWKEGWWQSGEAPTAPKP